MAVVQENEIAAREIEVMNGVGGGRASVVVRHARGPRRLANEVARGRPRAREAMKSVDSGILKGIMWWQLFTAKYGEHSRRLRVVIQLAQWSTVM